MRDYQNRLLILLLALSQAGCSFLSPTKTEPVNTYVLSAIPANQSTHGMHHATIMVQLPDTEAAYNTTQMAYTIKPYQIAYFGQNRWAETPAQMLQPLIVQSLLNTHYFHAVVTPPFSGRYDYTLSTQLSKLQMDFTRRPAVLQLSVHAQLVSTNNNQIIATKQFDITQPLQQNTPYSGVIAANIATEKFLRDLTVFSIQGAKR